MSKLFVADTSAIISYFEDVFGEPSRISTQALQILDDAFIFGSDIRISVPSVVFVEIFQKWYRTTDFAAKIHDKLFVKVREAPNYEIKSLDRGVLEQFVSLSAFAPGLESRDKIILASALELECPLITSDSKIQKLNSSLPSTTCIIC